MQYLSIRNNNNLVIQRGQIKVADTKNWKRQQYNIPVRKLLYKWRQKSCTLIPDHILLTSLNLTIFYYRIYSHMPIHQMLYCHLASVYITANCENKYAIHIHSNSHIATIHMLRSSS